MPTNSAPALHHRAVFAAAFIQRLLLFCSLTALTGCSSKPQESAQAATPPIMVPPKVKIAQPLTQQITDWDEYTGRIEAVNSVEVNARVSGYLEKVNFTAGAFVKKGDLLFVIDKRPFQAQLNYAQAELSKAKSKLELAKNDWARAENLLKVKAISAEEHDARQKGVKEAAAAVESAAAQVQTAALNLEFTQVRAPISGRISREFITAGNVVNGSEMNATRLATIVSLNPVYMAVDVDEQAILRYRREARKQGRQLEGMKVELALSDETDFPHQGQLDYVAPMENPATGTVTVRGVFSNSDELLSPGFFARMRIRGGAPYSALLLPDRAIGNDQAERFVWVVNAQQKVSQRKVVLGKQFGHFRVIQQGLQATDWVVLEGMQKLKPDSAIVADKITLTADAE